MVACGCPYFPKTSSPDFASVSLFLYVLIVIFYFRCLRFASLAFSVLKLSQSDFRVRWNREEHLVSVIHVPSRLVRTGVHDSLWIWSALLLLESGQWSPHWELRLSLHLRLLTLYDCCCFKMTTTQGRGWQSLFWWEASFCSDFFLIWQFGWLL